MCGLVGVVNKYTNGMFKQQHDIFNTLLFIDYLRGNDSTGVYNVHSGGDVQIAKEASDPIRFMNSKEYEKVMARSFSRGHALIGHNRKATRGDITDQNAHPFVVDDKIVLVHNGTMYGDHKKIADVEVDSHAIAHAIHEKGDVTKALSSFNAAYALIWFDVEKRELNFIRNSQRPLWWMETDSSWIWASEECMLDFVVKKFTLKPIQGPTELTADHLQTFFLKDSGAWGTRCEKLDIKTPVYQSPVVHQTQNNWGGHGRGRNYGNPWIEDVDWYDTEYYDRAPVPQPAATPAAQRTQVAANNNGRDLADALNRSLPAVLQPRPVEKADSIDEFERNMCHKLNKVVTLRQWQEAIVPQLEAGKRVTAVAFEYYYQNCKDGANGFILYSHLVDDEDIVLKHYFQAGMSTEERMIQIAGTNYIYDYQVARKYWRAMNPGTHSTYPEQPGYCIIEIEGAVLVEGGGMKNPLAQRTLH